METLDRQLCGLPLAKSIAFGERLEAESLKLGLWSEIDGVRTPVRIPARPWIIAQEAIDYLHEISWELRLAMRLLPHLLHTFDEAKAVVPLNRAEQHWLNMTGEQQTGPGERVFCRIDAVGRCHGDDWKESIKFVETNVVGIGGMTYAPAASTVLMNGLHSIFPSLKTLVPLPDPRLLLVDELLDHARFLGLSQTPRVALMDDLRLYRLGGEMARLAHFLQGLGIEAEAVDARDFALGTSGRACAGEREFDLIYRFLELRELDEIDEMCSLRTLQTAFREGRMIPSMAGELDHKSCYELFTDPKYRSAFSESQLEVFRNHVLWTRLLFERTTTDPNGKTIDLFEFVSANQAHLVIKPNRSYGGIGVVLGSLASGEDWRQALTEARLNPHQYVVQLLADVVEEELPVFSVDGAIRMTPCFMSLGLFPTADRLGALGRFSRGQVVNISQKGGVIPLATMRS